MQKAYRLFCFPKSIKGENAHEKNDWFPCSFALVMVLGCSRPRPLPPAGGGSPWAKSISTTENRSLLSLINGRIRELIYTYFNYVDSNGRTKEIPAYCVNPNTSGRPADCWPRREYQIHRQGKGQRSKGHGYHRQRLSYPRLIGTEVENKYHAYYATKMALWCYLLPN